MTKYGIFCNHCEYKGLPSKCNHCEPSEYKFYDAMTECNFRAEFIVDTQDNEVEIVCRLKSLDHDDDYFCDEENCIFMKLLRRSARTLPEVFEDGGKQ